MLKKITLNCIILTYTDMHLNKSGSLLSNILFGYGLYSLEFSVICKIQDYCTLVFCHDGQTWIYMFSVYVHHFKKPLF